MITNKNEQQAVDNTYHRTITGGDHFYVPPVVPSPCPGCGRCPTCGRGGYQWPYYPQYPYPTYPVITGSASNQSEVKCVGATVQQS
jgi:hypothetical protein